MSKFTFKEAAVKILEEADEPLSANSITNIALNKNMIKSVGSTPDATMGAILYTDINNNKSSQFKKLGKGLFSLKKQTISSKSPLLAIDNQNNLVKKKLIEKLQSIDPFQFEYLIAELLKKIGYENVEVTNRSRDKGIDIIANLTVGGLTSVKTVIQVKRFKTGNNIPGNIITQLRGSAEVDQRGLIITTSDFTKAARAEAKESKKMPVSLVNGEKLVELLFKYKTGIKEEVVKVYSLDSEFFENDFQEENSRFAEETKKKSLWPLPGGINSYLDTLYSLLDFINLSRNKKSSVLKWLNDNYDNISSQKTANGYLNVPKNMGLIEFINNYCTLTDAGRKVVESKKINYLHEVISNNILAFDDTYKFLLNSDDAKTEEEILEYINDNFNTEWSTTMQVIYRLQWLINLNKVKKIDGKYIAINTTD